MKVKVRNQLRQRKRKLLRRLSVEHGTWRSPMIRPTCTKLELAERQQAVPCGGIAAIVQLIKTTGLRASLNDAASVFKLHLPYDEADHIFNIALNLLAGGTCLDHIEHRRNDEAYLDALGAVRIPDPTTAGDFCRRFSQQQLRMVMQGINSARQRVWKQQEESFFDVATIEADGTTVENQLDIRMLAMRETRRLRDDNLSAHLLCLDSLGPLSDCKRQFPANSGPSGNYFFGGRITLKPAEKCSSMLKH